MFQVLAGILQLICIIIKNRFDKDKERQAQKEALRAETEEAIKNGIKTGDASSIRAVLDRFSQL